MQALAVDQPVIRQDIDEVQIVALSSLKIVGVVRRGDFYSSCPKLHVYKLCIGDDWDLALIQWVDGALSNRCLVPGRQTWL